VDCFLYVLAFVEMPNVVKCGCGSGDDKVRFVKVGLRHVPGIRIFYWVHLPHLIDPASKLVYEKVMFKHFDGLNLRYSWTQLSEDEEKEYENLGNNVEVVRPSDQGNEFFQRYIVVMNLFTYF